MTLSITLLEFFETETAVLEIIMWYCGLLFLSICVLMISVNGGRCKPLTYHWHEDVRVHIIYLVYCWIQLWRDLLTSHETWSSCKSQNFTIMPKGPACLPWKHTESSWSTQSTQQWTRFSFSIVRQHSCPLWYTPLRENWGLSLTLAAAPSLKLKYVPLQSEWHSCLSQIPDSPQLTLLPKVVHNSWTNARPESCISSICPATNVLSTCQIPGGVLTFSKTSICSHSVSGSKWHLQKLQQTSFHALVTHTKLDDS